MNRTIAPKTALPYHLSLGDVQREVLDNDFPIYVLDGTSQNIFQLSIVFRAGRFFERKRMLAGLCANMILKGTNRKSAYEIAESFDFYGAAVNFKANMYTAELSLYCLTSALPQLLPLLMEVLEEANFPEEELKKAKTKTKHKLAVQWEKNSYIATQHFNEAIFGIDHPFGYHSHLTIIDDLEREDVVQHFNRHFQLNKDSFGIVAGKISDKEIALINQYLGKLKVLDKGFNHAELQTKVEKDITVEAKNKLQTAIRVGMPTVNINHPDFDDLQILNTLLGGYFGSRLMTNIREEKGFTYGIYSFINPIMDTGYFCIATEVGEKYRNETLHEIEHEINRLKKELISDEELSMVKNYMIGQLMKSVDGPLNIISTLKNFLIFEMDLNEINKQLEAIHAIDAKRLQDLAKQYLNYEDMYKVVVG
jgi:predicted Zn-dependent peptidase